MSSLEIERPACLLCGSADARRSFEREFSPYALCRCKRCGFYYLSPRLTERAMRDHYASPSYYEGAGGGGYEDYSVQAKSLRTTYRELVRKMRRMGLCGGNLLEIGAGYGYFLAEARSLFERCDATELSEQGLEHVRVHADLAVRGGIEAIDGEGRYDLIVALQVIEHVYAPHAFVESAAKLLRPGGHLVLEAPNMRSPLRWLLGARWPSFKVPEHVSYFDARSLSRLVGDHDFEEVQPLAYSHAYPAALLAGKFGMAIPRSLRERPVWVPTTTVAVVGRKPGARA